MSRECKPSVRRWQNKKARSMAGFSAAFILYFGAAGGAAGLEKSTVGAASELAGAS